MNKFEHWLEKILMPFVIKFTTIPYVAALKDGMIAAMPFLVVGSIGTILKNLPIPGWSNLLATPFAGTTIALAISVWSTATFDLFTLISVIAIAYYYAIKLKVDPLFASLLSVVGFAIVTPLSVVIDKTTTAAIPLKWLGAQGLFVGMIMVFISVKIYAICIERNIVFSMPDTVPPNVVKSFAAMIPTFFVMVIGFILRFGVIGLGYNSFHEMIQKVIGAPLTSLGGSLGGALISVILISLLWSVGIHGAAIVTGIMNPIWLSIQAENFARFEAGLPVEHIITKTFIDFTKIGGAGFTIPFFLMIVFLSRSTQLRQLGKVSLIPGIFNINEPIIFGAPVVMNPILVIPFTIVPVVTCIITYVSMLSGLVPYPTGVTLPWAMPGLLAGYLITNSFRGVILQIVLIAVGFVIYYPFFKLYDNKLFNEENAMLVINQSNKKEHVLPKIS